MNIRMILPILEKEKERKKEAERPRLELPIPTKDFQLEELPPSKEKEEESNDGYVVIKMC